MLYTLLHPITLPEYSKLAQYEGNGNWAIKKYYQFPYRFFYRQKLRMIVSMLDSNRYRNILDYGSGPGIFRVELEKHTDSLTMIDKFDAIDTRWRFDVIICASVLEFVHLDFTIRMLKGMLANNGMLLVSSPMDTWASRLYFDCIRDTAYRHSHTEIIDSIRKHLAIKEVHTWMRLYFSLKAKLN